MTEDRDKQRYDRVVAALEFMDKDDLFRVRYVIAEELGKRGVQVSAPMPAGLGKGAKPAKVEAEAYKCEDCGEVVTTDDAEEASPLYECSDCGTRYDRENSADGDSNRCPDCNKFGAKVAEKACTECHEGELQPLVIA